jgi:hypothetical protein
VYLLITENLIKFWNLLESHYEVFSEEEVDKLTLCAETIEFHVNQKNGDKAYEESLYLIHKTQSLLNERNGNE